MTGVLVYALMRRLGVGAVGACIAAAPVLFDAYELNIEQHILSEALFSLLVAAGLCVLLWRRPAHRRGLRRRRGCCSPPRPSRGRSGCR